jgi:hypothetical protein
MAAILDQARPPSPDQWTYKVAELARRRRFTEAVDVLTARLRGMQADEAIAIRLNELAWSMVNPRSPDAEASDLALTVAKAAVALTKEQRAEILGTLAEAQFLSGHLEEAMATAGSAIELCKTSLNSATLPDRLAQGNLLHRLENSLKRFQARLAEGRANQSPERRD